MSFDPWISEWGNPLEHLLLLLRNNAHSVPALGRCGWRVGRGGQQRVQTSINTLNT